MKDIQFSFDSDRQRRSANPWTRRVLVIACALVVIVVALLFLYKRDGGKAKPVKPPVPAESVVIPPVEEIPVRETPPVENVTPRPEQIASPVVPAEIAVEAEKMVGNEPLESLEFNGRKLSDIKAEADELNKKREFVQARKLLEPVIQSGQFREYSRPWLAIAGALSVANTGIFFSDIPFEPKKVNYLIKRGDTLDRIAATHKTTVEGIQKSNSIPENSSIIRLGDNLRIYSGDWKIKVSRSNHYMILYDGNEVFKVYQVGIGKQERTPNGTFVISSKVKEPEWYAPDGRVIPFGDPANLLGTRWLALQSTGETGPAYKGLGIHGTWLPQTIGTSSSNGCVRMRNQEVEELYAIVPRLTPVEITD